MLSTAAALFANATFIVQLLISTRLPPVGRARVSRTGGHPAGWTNSNPLENRPQSRSGRFHANGSPSPSPRRLASI